MAYRYLSGDVIVALPRVESVEYCERLRRLPGDGLERGVCGVWGMEYGVCVGGVWSMEYGVWSVECGVGGGVWFC